MTRVLGFLLDIKGEMCRLGYLLIISRLITDDDGATLDELGRILENETSSNGRPNWDGDDFRSGLSSTALIPTGAVARNIVEFAGKIGFFSFSQNSLGAKAIISNKVFTNVFEVSNPLELTPTQQIFLLKCLLEADGHALIKLMRYFSGKTNLGRQEIMNGFMEIDESDPSTGAYPKSLEEEIALCEGVTKGKLEIEYDDSFTWKEQRVDLQTGSGQWNTSELYAKYRHQANPRPEWLVDLGLLDKIGTGPLVRFSPTSKFQSVLDAIEEWFEDEDSDIYSKVSGIYYPVLTEPEENDLMQEIVNSWQIIKNAGALSATIEYLVELTILRCIENGMLISENLANETITSMVSLYPKNVILMVDPSGAESVIRITDGFSIRK